MTYKKVLAFLALTFAVSLTACAPRGPSNKDRAALHLQLGTSLFSQGQYPQALQEYLEAERLNPDDAVIQNNLGLAYYVREKFEKSEFHLKQAVRFAPKYTEAKVNLGRVLIDRGSTKEAIKVLEPAAEDLTYPAPQEPLSYLGIAYFKDKRPKKAYEALFKSLKADQTQCKTSIYYGRTLLDLNEPEKAASAFDQAIMNCKNVAADEAHYYAGLGYFRLGQREKARARLQEVTENYAQGPYASDARKLLQTLK